MYIPSYDDLTPSIPDVSMRDTLGQVERLLPGGGRPAPATPRRATAVDAALAPPAAGHGTPLYACLRSPRAPETAMAVARDFSPRIERHGAATVVLDVSGLGRLLGDAHAIGGELERTAASRAPGIRIAIAPTQTAARLLAIAHSTITVVADDAAASLADVPVTVLRQLLDDLHTPRPESAASADTVRAARRAAQLKMLETIERWGLKTLGEVAALPASDLSQRLGQGGLVLQRLARGEDAAPLVPDPAVPRFIARMELEWPIDALEPLSFILPRLLDPLSLALERADRGAAAIRLDLRLTDRSTHARVLQLPAAMRDARVLRTLLLLDLESHPPSAAIDVVSIEIDPAPGRIVQYSLLERATPSVETMATLMARLHALVGEGRCGAPALLDTHRPDGFVMAPLAGSGRQPTAHAPGVRLDVHGHTHAPPQLRRFRPPIAVRVMVERGRPVHVAIDRRGMPGGRIEQQAGPWRTSGGWWDGPVAHWDRDEWDVAFADGTLARLFYDRTTAVWFIEGVHD
jgi:protein ImuB